MISIITSLYRSDAHIEKYAKRLKKATSELLAAGVDFEVLCIANEPTPIEESICGELARESWFRFIPVPRESLYATWNRGITMSRGNICTFWNVDDIRFSKAIIDGIRLIKEKVTDVVYFPFIYKRYVKVLGISMLAKRRVVMPQTFDRKLFLTTMQCGPFFMFSKSIIDDVGLFDPSFRIAGDYEWCVRATTKNARFLRCDTIGGIFTNDGRSLSGSRSTLQQDENRRIVEKYR